jgi:hypothetical protein
MNRIKIVVLCIIVISVTVINPVAGQFQGPLDPVRLDSWVINAGMGPGSHYFGNGTGFGPALKVSFEKGMWDLGPGVITLGGEYTTSFFAANYGNGYRETWVNAIFGARAAYHYGWNVEGLDTYAGFPAGIGFCIHSYDDFPGYKGSQPVYPYAGFFLGASYFFNKNIGINGELGYNATQANIGVVWKIF